MRRAAMPAVKRLAGVTPQVNLRSARRQESVHLGFETQGRRHQKSKTGVSVAPQKGHVSSRNKKKMFGVDAKMDEIFVDCFKAIDWKMVCP